MLTLEIKKEIYELLLSRQDMVKMGGSYTKHVVTRLLAEYDYTARRFGFWDEEDFLAAMPEFLTITPGTGDLSGMVWVGLHTWEEVPQSTITLLADTEPPVVPEIPVVAEAPAVAEASAVAEIPAVPAKPSTDERDAFCRRAYDYLLTHERCSRGQTFLTAEGGMLLAAGGFDYKAQGFEKLGAFFRAMENAGYVTMEMVTVAGGGSQYAISLCRQQPAAVQTEAVPDEIDTEALYRRVSDILAPGKRYAIEYACALLAQSGLSVGEYGCSDRLGLLRLLQPAYLSIHTGQVDTGELFSVVWLHGGVTEKPKAEPPAAVTAAPMSLPLEVMQRVRDMVVEEVGYDQEISVGKLGVQLKAAEIHFKDYGFSKLKGFLEAMEAVSLHLSERVLGGVPQSFVTVCSADGDGGDSSAAPWTMTDADKRYLYGLLIRQFTPGQPYLKADVGQVLRANDVSKEDYGFALLQELLEAMTPTYLTLQEKQTEEGKTFSQVILQELPGFDTARPAELAPEAAEPVADGGLPEAVMQQVCAMVERELGAGDEIGIGTVGLWLQKNGIDYARYGFTKLKPFLKAIQPAGLVVSDRVLGGVPQSFVSLMAPKTETDSVIIEEEDEAVAGRRLDEAEKQKIYRLLRRRFSTDEYHMATINLYLHENGYKKELYGFSKAKDFIRELARDFLTLREQPMNGVEQTLVTVRDVPAWNTEELHPRFPAELREPAVILQSSALLKLRQMLGLDSDSDLSLQLETLDEDYQKARAGADGLFEVANKQKAYAYRFTLSLTDQTGRSLEGYLGYTTVGGAGRWVLYQFAAKKEPQGERLQQYADMRMEQFLEQLAGIALPERWGADYSILSNYIRYTFDRLEREGKLCESRDRTLTAFNTGLVNEMFDDIYACFEQYCDAHNNVVGREFIGFCTGAEQGLGKRLRTSIRPLPQPASYLTEKEDLLFDLELELQEAEEHILLDNIHRLPLEFLSRQLGGYDGIGQLIQQIRQLPDRQTLSDKELKNQLPYMQLRGMLKQNINAYNELRVQLRDAIEIARRKVRWNYKTATPCYYPTEDCMCLLLPLALADRNKVDAALVVRLYRNTEPYLYRGETILTLPQAYRNARLVSRPDNDWLNEHTSGV